MRTQGRNGFWISLEEEVRKANMLGNGKPRSDGAHGDSVDRDGRTLVFPFASLLKFCLTFLFLPFLPKSLPPSQACNRRCLDLQQRKAEEKSSTFFPRFPDLPLHIALAPPSEPMAVASCSNIRKRYNHAKECTVEGLCTYLFAALMAIQGSSSPRTFQVQQPKLLLL